MKLKDLIPPGMLPAPEEDAIALLRADHDKIEDLFTRYGEIKYGRAGGERKQLVGEICSELRIHAAIEVEFFYPAVRAEIADDDLMNEALIEHEGVERLISELEASEAEDEMLNARMHVLDAYVSHHVREEEENIFPKARDTRIDMAALAQAMLRGRGRLTRAARDRDVPRTEDDGNHVREPAMAPRKARGRRNPAETRAPR